MNTTIEIIWIAVTVVLVLALISMTLTARTLAKRNDRQAKSLVEQGKAIQKQAVEEESLRATNDTLKRKVRAREGRMEELVKLVAQEQRAYTRYECTFCSGTGTQQIAGSVQHHPEQLEADFPCDVCKGDGFLYKRKLEPTDEETETERWARQYKAGAKAAEVSLQTTDPAVLQYAAQEKLDETGNANPYWLGFMSKVAEAIDQLEEDMEVNTEIDAEVEASGE